MQTKFTRGTSECSVYLPYTFIRLLSSFATTAIAAYAAHKEIIKKETPDHLLPREIPSRTRISSPIFSVYSIPLFRGKIISAENGRKGSRCRCVLLQRAVNRSKRELEISAGRLVLNYDVDKMSEDTSQEIPPFRYRALSRAPYTRLERSQVCIQCE